MDKQHQQQEQQQRNSSKKWLSIVSLDESFFFYDSLVRRVWIDEDKRPIVQVTGSHKHSCIFGAICLGGKQKLRQYDKFNGDTFLDYLKKIHSRFPKCYLFMDKASPHFFFCCSLVQLHVCLVRPRHHSHRPVRLGAFGERRPGGHDLGRLETPIRAVLVPRDIARVVRVLDEEPAAPA